MVPLLRYGSAGLKTACTVVGSGFFSKCSYLPSAPKKIDANFVGINVSTGTKPETDDYIINKLREVGFKHVRVDFMSSEKGGPKERFIHRLLAEKFKVCLRLMQAPEKAYLLDTDSIIQTEWADFIQDCLSTFQHEFLEAIEIAATPNRRKWSGYWYNQYFKAWEIAYPLVRELDKKLIGPTVSDFEPLYDLIFLNGLKEIGALPQIHGVNLFCERTKTPEAYDERVMGKMLAKSLKLNLIKKANIFAHISQRFKIKETWCMHTCWNSERVARWSDQVEIDRASYLKRYLLCASKSHIDRIYWGPLVGYPDGLIYDSTSVTPALERVAHYPLISDETGCFVQTESFEQLTRLLLLNDED